MFMSQHWICDTCGENIENQKDGWVEWIVVRNGEEREGRDLRLVHHMPASPLGKPQGCQFDEKTEFSKDQGILADLPLENFLGSNGLMRLLSFLSQNELPKEEVLEMIKRLFIPGYDVARHHFKRAIYEGVFEPNMPENYYFLHDIEATIEFLEREVE